MLEETGQSTWVSLGIVILKKGNVYSRERSVRLINLLIVLAYVALYTFIALQIAHENEIIDIRKFVVTILTGADECKTNLVDFVHGYRVKLENRTSNFYEWIVNIAPMVYGFTVLFLNDVENLITKILANDKELQENILAAIKKWTLIVWNTINTFFFEPLLKFSKWISTDEQARICLFILVVWVLFLLFLHAKKAWDEHREKTAYARWNARNFTMNPPSEGNTIESKFQYWLWEDAHKVRGPNNRWP